MNVRLFGLTLVLFCGPVRAATAAGFTKYNYPSRCALIANVCPHLKLSDFTWGNGQDDNDADRFQMYYHWENTGQKQIVAFELDVLKYDPFNRPLVGSRCIFPGHNSADYEPLRPGEKDNDGGADYGSEETFTAICYVGRVRFDDGTIWTVDPSRLMGEIKKIAPDILNVGPLEPPQKKDQK